MTRRAGRRILTLGGSWSVPISGTAMEISSETEEDEDVEGTRQQQEGRPSLLTKQCFPMLAITRGDRIVLAHGDLQSCCVEPGLSLCLGRVVATFQIQLPGYGVTCIFTDFKVHLFFTF